MAKLTPITARQRELLRKIADPPPDWHLSGQEATAVYALRARGLVSTHSAMSYHTAMVTEKGRNLLAGRVSATPAPSPRVKPPTPQPAKPLKIQGSEVIAQVVAARKAVLQDCIGATSRRPIAVGPLPANPGIHRVQIP